MDMDSQPNSPRQVSDLWLEDGSLVIKAGHLLLKIHRSTLVAQPPVFADMLSFPPSQDQEFLYGCPFVELPDDPESVEVFLRAITLLDFFLPPPAAADYHVVAGVLRMAHKYDCSILRSRALRHLSTRFTTTLVDFTHRNYISKPLFRGYEGLQDKAYTLDCVSLFYEVDALWCLPVLYHTLTSWIPGFMTYIINGIEFKSQHYGMTPDQQITLLAGREYRRQDIVASMSAYSSVHQNVREMAVKSLAESFLQHLSSSLLIKRRTLG
ncbi:hypothetical protein DL96DRAFT_1816825 [Flagelloscypha sp. PMI_526]|nr:hypothetical protein DL96DRAFT_1816825 [Flagelloscypha sp. PMI_526]